MHETAQIPNRPSDLLDRLWKACLGLALVVAGSFFCWWLFATWQKASRMDAWNPTPAEILSSKVVPWRFNEYSHPEFQPKVRYRYEAGGAVRESDRIRRVTIRSAHPEKAQDWVKKFPTGAQVTAWVDPANPAYSVLRRDTKAALYSIWFPALFVVGGMGMMWTALRPPAR